MISKIRGWKFLGSRILRVGLIGLVLALAFGSAGGIPRARATPDSAQTASVSYSVFANPESFEIRNCPKAKQKIYVGVSRTVTKAISGKPYESSRSVNGFDIQVKTKPGNGSVSPSTVTVISMDRTGTFQTVFIYDPQKVGTDTITFSGQPTPDDLLAPLIPGSIADATVQVKVMPCKYKVNLNFRGQYSDETYYASELGLLEETIIEPGDDGVLRGSADFEWNLFNHALTGGLCVFEPSTATSRAEIMAQPDDENDSLRLTITYADVQIPSTVDCGPSGSSTGEATVLLSALGPTTATISDSGGVVRFSQAWPAESGTFTNIVEPEEEQPAVSRMSSPVAWLPGWFETAFLLQGSR